MKFCTQCGTKFEPEARFCQKCGYDTASDQTVSETNFKPADEPEVINKPVPEPVPPVRTPEPAAQQTGKKTWLWIVLVVIGVGALGTAGWFAYNKFFASSKETPADTQVNTAVPGIADADTTASNTKATKPPKVAAPEQPKAKTKPPVKTDEETAKQKEKQKTKEQSEPAKQNATPAKQTKPDADVKESSDKSKKDSKAKVLIEVGRTKTPKDKNPKNPTKLTIRKPTMIVRITTDHYNDGLGTSSAGSISIKDSEGKITGTFRADGKSGKDGIPNAKWVAEPQKVLEKGTYYIWDSDMPTWSKTPAGGGFIVVEGYEIK